MTASSRHDPPRPGSEDSSAASSEPRAAYTLGRSEIKEIGRATEKWQSQFAELARLNIRPVETPPPRIGPPPGPTRDQLQALIEVVQQLGTLQEATVERLAVHEEHLATLRARADESAAARRTDAVGQATNARVTGLSVLLAGGALATGAGALVESTAARVILVVVFSLATLVSLALIFRAQHRLLRAGAGSPRKPPS